MNLHKVNKVLADHKLRKTDIRKKVLSVFLDKDSALSNQNIEDNIREDIDRTTLYRTLNKFVDHGIIHRIENANTTYYALCHNCEVHDHDDDHVHFQCIECEKIECFHQKKRIELSIPTEYEVKKMNILLEGLCADCA